MAYSTAAQIRANEYVLQTTISADLTDIVIEDRISFADKQVNLDVGVMISVPITGTVPDVVNLLSIYKATELSLIWLYTRKREAIENDDIQYWRNEYDVLLKKIKDGEVDLGAYGTGTADFTNCKAGIEPALGVGEYGEFMNEDDLIKERPVR